MEEHEGIEIHRREGVALRQEEKKEQQQVFAKLLQARFTTGDNNSRLAQGSISPLNPMLTVSTSKVRVQDSLPDDNRQSSPSKRNEIKAASKYSEKSYTTNRLQKQEQFDSQKQQTNYRSTRNVKEQQEDYRSPKSLNSVKSGKTLKSGKSQRSKQPKTASNQAQRLRADTTSTKKQAKSKNMTQTNKKNNEIQ